MRSLYVAAVLGICGPCHSYPQEIGAQCRGIYRVGEIQDAGRAVLYYEYRLTSNAPSRTIDEIYNSFLLNLEKRIAYRNIRLSYAIKDMSFNDVVACFPAISISLDLAETKRHKVDQEKADARLKDEEHRARAAKPEFRLGKSFAQYIVIKNCHSSRIGYATIYISDAELEVARNNIALIEAKTKSLNPDIDTARIWAASSEIAKQQTHLDRTLCQDLKASLETRAANLAPESKAPIKDF